MEKIPEHFLWGSEVAANQAKGAYLKNSKGLSTSNLQLKWHFQCDNATAHRGLWY